MKKTATLLALFVFSLVLFSCDGDTTAEDQALYETMANGNTSGSSDDDH